MVAYICTYAYVRIIVEWHIGQNRYSVLFVKKYETFHINSTPYDI